VQFGAPIADAIRREYTLVVRVGGFYVYEPKGVPALGPASEALRLSKLAP
jgi:hypothetical protein